MTLARLLPRREKGRLPSERPERPESPILYALRKGRRNAGMSLQLTSEGQRAYAILA